jgi:hypothetical protein
LSAGPGGIHSTQCRHNQCLSSSRPRSSRPAITLWSPCRGALGHVGPGARRPWSQVALEPGGMMQLQQAQPPLQQPPLCSRPRRGPACSRRIARNRQSLPTRAHPALKEKESEQWPLTAANQTAAAATLADGHAANAATTAAAGPGETTLAACFATEPSEIEAYLTYKQ